MAVFLRVLVAEALCMAYRSVEEIVALLSDGAVAVINCDPPDVQRFVVEQIGSIVDYWERRDMVLDPVQLSVVVESLVIVIRTHAYALLAAMKE